MVTRRLTLAPPPLSGLSDQLRVRMAPGSFTDDGLTMRYALSDNAAIDAAVDDSRSIWAVNIHGFFAGGGMYWRESARLAGGLGWKVVNPSLPSFGGSQPLEWSDLSMSAFAARLAALLDHLEVERAVVLGHSMGGAVAMQFAHDHPDRCLGVIYRDGAGPSSWKTRHGLLTKITEPISPDVGSMVEIVAGAVADIPDLAWGRLGSFVRGVLPDARRNIHSLADTFPVAAMLFYENLDPVILAVSSTDIPILPMWGRSDRLVPRGTALDFSDIVGEPVVWIAGGHSWMLPRPVTQLRTLQRHPQGQDFVRRVAARDADLAAASAA
ncbi:MAG TPA: alpha/beta hydrolase [Acidimicrobiales bacterium]